MEQKAFRERRSGVDRRKGSSNKLQWKYLFTGSRRDVRRRNDPKEVYVDIFGLRDFFAVLIVLVLSVLDAAFTLYHLNRGAEEMNLLMAYALDIGVGYFFFVKYSVTAIGVLILCIHKNFRFIRGVFVGIISLYTLLIGYHIFLLFL